jgi:hypothetical protein
VKKKVIVLVPDGVGIKNYVYTSVFKNRDADLTLMHNFDAETLEQIRPHCDFQDTIDIPDYSEGVKEKFLRELIHLSRLKFNAKQFENPTILFNWKKNHKSFKLKIFYAAVSVASRFISRYKTILKLEKAYDNSLIKNPFYNEVIGILKDHDPDVIFCTHQRALKAAAIFKAANQLSIETTTVIYSWDNLPKARLALKADKYLVWSDYMKQEMHSMYPEIPSEKIKITGTPQFEFFTDSNYWMQKEDFFNTYNLNPSHTHICFSGDDITTSPYDPFYLNDLAESLTKNSMDEEYRIIFRRCPVDISGRYDWVIEKYPDLIVEIEPLWNFNSDRWTAVYPTYEDVTLLVSLARYSDVVVNVGSTMAFDFGMFGKPCIYINYDHVKDKSWSVSSIYKFQHFRSMPSRDAVYWLNSKNEIAATIQKALEGPETDISAWFKIVAEATQSACDNIYKELMS